MFLTFVSCRQFLVTWRKNAKSWIVCTAARRAESTHMCASVNQVTTSPPTSRRVTVIIMFFPEANIWKLYNILVVSLRYVFTYLRVIKKQEIFFIIKTISEMIIPFFHIGHSPYKVKNCMLFQLIFTYRRGRVFREQRRLWTHLHERWRRLQLQLQRRLRTDEWHEGM